MTDREQRMIEAAAQTGYAAEAAERAVIGSLVMDYDKCAQIVAEMTVDDFYFEAHKAIFKAVKLAKGKGLAVDLVTIDQEIQRSDPINGGMVMDKLLECIQSAEVWAVESHCRIVKELAARRRAIALLGQFEYELRNPQNDINGIIDKLISSTGDLLVGGHKWVSVQDVLINTFDYIDQRQRGEITSITSGIGNLDRLVGGFFGGELTVIGARPAVGKSVFGMNVALAAARQGYKVGIVSREMTDIQYGQRILSYAGGVDGSKIRRATLEKQDWEHLTEGMTLAAELPINFLFSVRTVEDLRAEVQRKHNRGEIDMLVVDYLQLMDAAQKYREDRLRVGHISKALKNIATDFNIPVIALAQVKRFAGGARAKMPTLEDLKDSGAIEQDADNVIFLHIPDNAEDEYVDPRDRDYFQGYEEQGFTYLCIGVAKQRQSATGKCCVLFSPKYMRYYAIDRTTPTEERAMPATERPVERNEQIDMSEIFGKKTTGGATEAKTE